MKATTAIAAAILFAVPGLGWAQAQVSITSPDPREPVPASGATVNLPFSAKLLFTSGSMVYCGGAQFSWMRDATDGKACSGNACSVSYPESAITRGPHTARYAVNYLWAYAGISGCYPGYAEGQKSYIVQYAPTVSISRSAWTLRVGEAGAFGASGTIDPEYAARSYLTYSWTFGDGGGASGANVTHAWSQCGDYRVKVTASDGALTATATTQVTVTSSNCTVEIK